MIFLKPGFEPTSTNHGSDREFTNRPGADPIKLFFLHILFFGVKVGHFTINYFFLYVTNAKAYHQKMEKIFVSEEKKFYRICYCRWLPWIHFIFQYSTRASDSTVLVFFTILWLIFRKCVTYLYIFEKIVFSCFRI